MRISDQTQEATPALGESFGSVELELALGAQEPAERGFEESVRAALDVIGGEFLFDMPNDGTIEDASRIAAVRAESENEIVFLVLSEDGSTIRLADRDEIGERFHGFARAFIGVLTRIRDEMPSLGLEVEGSA